METRIVPADEAGLASAAALLRQGSLVAFPTETVYGLGGQAGHPESIRAIFSAKGRPASDPLILHLPSADLDPAVRAGWIAAPLTEAAPLLAQAFWPGPLTLILKKGAHTLPEMTAGRDTVAVRCPAHPVARTLLQTLGFPLAAPSANRFGRISPTDAEAVRQELGGKIPLILDGGPCAVGLESTVLNLVSPTPEILRPGAISADQLAQLLGQKPRPPSFALSSGESQIAPGQLASHYAPHTALYLCTEPIRTFSPETFHLLFRQPDSGPPPNALVLDAIHHPERAARELYRALRQGDKSGSKRILVDPVPESPWAEAIRDRLTRASSGTASWDGQTWRVQARPGI